MRHYDKYGRRIPSSRADADRPTLAAAILIVTIMLASIAFGLRFVRTHKGAEYRASLTAHDSMCAITTEQGVTIRLYVMIDPDTGAQYVVSDKGGVCPRTEVDDG